MGAVHALQGSQRSASFGLRSKENLYELHTRADGRVINRNPLGAIVFSDKDLPLEGRDYHRALFIKAEVKGKITYYVMVDNGSTINVCPLKILSKLGLAVVDLKPFEVIIKAYDDTRRPVEGNFRALIKTGPIEA